MNMRRYAIHPILLNAKIINLSIFTEFVVILSEILILKKMDFIEAGLAGAYLIKPVRHGDGRGYFCETFRFDEFERAIGKVNFIQDNESLSIKGVVRGLHYQAAEASQAKLVRVVYGRVLDVIVDLRRNSPTFGKHISTELSGENGCQLFVPRGFAHGFIVLSEKALFQYKVDNPYAPESERCIRFDDPCLSIDFPLPVSSLIFSEKDMKGVSFKEAELF